MPKLKFMKAVALCLILTGCTTEVIRYQTLPLSHGPRPKLPAIQESEIECLQQDTILAFWRREKLMADYISELETTIDSTQHAQHQDH